jgi:hypothetical protein
MSFPPPSATTKLKLNARRIEEIILERELERRVKDP